MPCVCSSLCYGWITVDVECLQGKGNGGNITCHWRYRVKHRYTATHFQTRPDIAVSVQAQRSGRFPPEKETKYQILQRNGWAPGSVWTGVEKRKLTKSTGDLTPKPSFHNKSLSRKQETFYPVIHTHTHIRLQLWVWYHDIKRVWEVSFAQKYFLNVIFYIHFFPSKNSNLLHMKQVFLQCFPQQLQTSREYYWKSFK